MKMLYGMLCALVFSAAAMLFSCGDDKPTRPRPEPPRPLLALAIGTFWVYQDSVWEGDSVLARTDTVIVSDSVRDSLGLRWVLSENIPWFYPQFVLKADTICTVELGSGGEYLARQFWPPADTAYDYDIVINDFVRRRHVQWLDTTIHTAAGDFDSCIAYITDSLEQQSLTYVLAPGIGFVYAQIIPDTTQPAPDFVRHTWLVKYQPAE